MMEDKVFMQKIDVLLGLQWGDEGKGKIVDILTPRYDIVARFQGGPNAGHTLLFDGVKNVLHQIPSGIFRPAARNLIGSGVVIDPIVFQQEAEKLQDLNVDIKKNLFVSKKATLIIPTHRLLDQIYEQEKGDTKIGSTLKGISPAYQDKIGRRGLRVGDILFSDFIEKWESLSRYHHRIITCYGVVNSKDYMKKEFLAAIDFLKTCHLVDSEYFLADAIQQGSQVLAEGAQGTFLDIDFGSYPFVTSSSTIAAGACTGLGVPPSCIRKTIGIFKAYSTRVGEGPFPTELHDEDGELIREKGNERGATTGRPRRCGWLDIPALKYALTINGVSELYMMKADVLDTFETIKVCTSYQLADGTLTDRYSYELLKEQPIPIYKTFEGWNTSLAVASKENMPMAFKRYMLFIEQALGLRITLVSTGPDRTQTIFL